MKRCAIITGGVYSPLTDIGSCDLIIACDKGYEYAIINNVRVDLLIGDFDSYEGKIPDELEVIRLPVAKDDTDTMHAYREAIRRNYDEVYLYCALGGRLDHLYANIQCAIYGARHQLKTVFIDEKETIIVTDERKIILPRRADCGFSVFAADICKNVSIRGALYEISNVTLENSFPLGQSNSWLQDEVIITKEEGIAIIIESKRDNL